MSSKKRKLAGQSFGVALLSLLATPLLAIEGSWQLGVNAGVSNLSPDTDGSGFTLDEEQSTAFNVYFGLDITPVFSTELAFSDLGEAELSGDQTIGYQAISLGATAYIWGASEADRRSEGLSAYVRLGLSSIDNEADIELDESNNIALWFGAGVQYPLADNFGLRAELVSYDGDAQALLGGVYWRTGSDSRRSNSGVRPPVASQQPVPQPSTQNSQSGTSASTVPDTQQRTAPSSAQCPAGAAGKIADARECALLNSVLAGVSFNGNTATLSQSSQPALNQVVSAMQSNPGVILEISAHTQSLGNAQAEAQLTSQRVRSVALFLVQNGVPVSRLSAKSFGATQPVGDNATVAGRNANNRIELKSR